MTADLLGQWLQPGRAFRLSNAGEIGTNPDQRLHDDTRNLTELTANLGIGLFQATLLLFSFIGVCGSYRASSYSTRGVGISSYRATWSGQH